MDDHDLRVRLFCALVVPAALVVLGGLLVGTISLLLGLMWLTVWGPYVISCWVLAAVGLLVVRGSWPRRVIALVVAAVAAVPLGALTSAGILWLLEYRDRAAGTLGGGTLFFETPSYYWFTAPIAAVGFAAAALLTLIGSEPTGTAATDDRAVIGPAPG